MQQQQHTQQQGRISAVVNVEQPSVLTMPPRGQLLPAATMDHPLMKKQEKNGERRKVPLLDSVERHEVDTLPDELPVDFYVQCLRPKKAPKPTIAADVSKTTTGTSLLPEPSSFDVGDEEQEEEQVEVEAVELVVHDDEPILDPTVPDTPTVPTKKKQLELQPTPRMKVTDLPPALPEPLSFDDGEGEGEAGLVAPDAEEHLDPTVPDTPTVPINKKQIELQPTPPMKLTAPPPALLEPLSFDDGEGEEAGLVVPDAEEPLDPTVPDTATVPHKRKQPELQPTPRKKLTDPSPAAVKSSSSLSPLQNKKKKTRTPKTGTILRPTPRSTTTCNSSPGRMGQGILSTSPTNMKKPPVAPPSTSTKKRCTPRPSSSSTNKKKKPTPKVAVENSISRPTRRPPPADPPLRQRLQKKFHGRYFSGVINEIWYDGDGTKQWHVKYEDDDEEDLDIDQIMTDTNILWLE